MSNNSVEFIVNKIKKSDEFLSEFHFRNLKNEVIKDVHEYIEKEIRLFKKKHGLEFVEYELKKKVEDIIQSRFDDSKLFNKLEDCCLRFVWRQMKILKDNDVLEKIKNNLEKYSLKLFDEKLQDNLNYHIEESVKKHLKSEEIFEKWSKSRSKSS